MAKRKNPTAKKAGPKIRRLRVDMPSVMNLLEQRRFNEVMFRQPRNLKTIEVLYAGKHLATIDTSKVRSAAALEPLLDRIMKNFRQSQKSATGKRRDTHPVDPALLEQAQQVFADIPSTDSTLRAQIGGGHLSQTEVPTLAPADQVRGISGVIANVEKLQSALPTLLAELKLRGIKGLTDLYKELGFEACQLFGVAPTLIQVESSNSDEDPKYRVDYSTARPADPPVFLKALADHLNELSRQVSMLSEIDAYGLYNFPSGHTLHFSSFPGQYQTVSIGGTSYGFGGRTLTAYGSGGEGAGSLGNSTKVQHRFVHKADAEADTGKQSEAEQANLRG